MIVYFSPTDFQPSQSEGEQQVQADRARGLQAASRRLRQLPLAFGREAPGERPGRHDEPGRRADLVSAAAASPDEGGVHPEGERHVSSCSKLFRVA